MRVLLVDDNPEALKVISAFLKSLGHRVEACESGREALLWLHDLKPELVLTDLEMPEMDGYELLRQIRLRSQFASLPIVCITGSEATNEEVMSHGFQAILRKPITLADVLGVIDEIKNATTSSTPVAG